MDHGTFEIPLYRVWNVKAQAFIYGMEGTRSTVNMQFHDWLCNEFCCGYNPKTFTPDDTEREMGITRESLQRKYNAARRGYRVVRVKIRISSHVDGMSAVVI